MSQILKSKARMGSSRHARSLMLGAAALLTTGLILARPAMAADDAGGQAACDPYKDYSCLDKYLGDNVTDRIWNYYKLEWGEAGAPTDPNAQPSRRDGWPAT